MVGIIKKKLEGKDYKWYISGIEGGLYATYHLLGEPETTIECWLPPPAPSWAHKPRKSDDFVVDFQMFFNVKGEFSGNFQGRDYSPENTPPFKPNIL